MLHDFPIYAYIPASDLARARQFYETRIGLRAKEVREGGVVYEFGQGTACFLYLSPNAGTSKASQAFWSVPDVDALIVALKAKGVKFEDYPDVPGKRSAQGAITEGGAKAAWFKDSEGNIMALIEEAPGT